MPKRTFFNISEEKRSKIINSAIYEFCENTFENASINNIIKKAEISRGSFYQYFKDKEDIFEFVVKHSINKIGINIYEKEIKEDLFEFLQNAFFYDIKMLYMAKDKDLIINYIKYVYTKKYGILDDTFLNPEYFFKNKSIEEIYKKIDIKEIKMTEFKNLMEFCIQIGLQIFIKGHEKKLSQEECMEIFSRRIKIISKGLLKNQGGQNVNE